MKQKTFLKAHIIPNVDLGLDNFEEYIAERRVLLHEKIRRIFNNGNPEEPQKEIVDSLDEELLSIEDFEDQE